MRRFWRWLCGWRKCEECGGCGFPRDWYCPTCVAYLSSCRVTHEECCDTCGTQLTGVDCPICFGKGEVKR